MGGIISFWTNYCLIITRSFLDFSLLSFENICFDHKSSTIDVFTETIKEKRDWIPIIFNVHGITAMIYVDLQHKSFDNESK